MNNQCLMILAAIVCGTTLSAHGSNCDPKEFLVLKAREKAMVVTEKQIAALPQHAITTSTSLTRKGTYRGPYASDVIALTRFAESHDIVVYTWDGGRIKIAVSDLDRYGVILAISLNDVKLRLDDLGPLSLVYPYDQHEELHSPKPWNKMAWQVCRIDIS